MRLGVRPPFREEATACAQSDHRTGNKHVVRCVTDTGDLRAQVLTLDHGVANQRDFRGLTGNTANCPTNNRKPLDSKPFQSGRQPMGPPIILLGQTPFRKKCPASVPNVQKQKAR